MPCEYASVCGPDKAGQVVLVMKPLWMVRLESTHAEQVGNGVDLQAASYVLHSFAGCTMRRLLYVTIVMACCS